jgi:hypothetical protein
LTLAAGASLTVTTAVPTLPSLVAVIVLVPALTPLTSPVTLTLATAALVDDQTTAWSLITLPFASFSVAIACVVPPTLRLADGRVTETEFTGASSTTALAEPLVPSLVAVTVAVPGISAETSPSGDMDTWGEFGADQVTFRLRTFPSPSFTTALACAV